MSAVYLAVQCRFQTFLNKTFPNSFNRWNANIERFANFFIIPSRSIFTLICL